MSAGHDRCAGRRSQGTRRPDRRLPGVHSSPGRICCATANGAACAPRSSRSATVRSGSGARYARCSPRPGNNAAGSTKSPTSSVHYPRAPIPARRRPSPTSATAALRSLPPLIAVPVAAKLLGISRSAAYRYAASGDLPTRHLGGRPPTFESRIRTRRRVPLWQPRRSTGRPSSPTPATPARVGPAPGVSRRVPGRRPPARLPPEAQGPVLETSRARRAARRPSLGTSP